ncbi:MAG: alpha-glucan family phosphorylase [marine benthic group bacterium]|nr:alpha-glucan family phosphorylase [Gemmatimonadota bacterium]
MNEREYPALPARIARLDALSRNLWWAWQPEARALFRRLGLNLWVRSRKNPVAMLHELDPERLEALSGDPLFLREYDAVMAEFEDVMAARRSWFADTYGDTGNGGIAYFCAEFGVHTSIPIYSGGLGILAGDHFKEGSDLGVPLKGVGLLYQKGYFRQRLGEHGEQHAIDEPFHPDSMPLERVWGNGDDGSHAIVTLAGRDVHLGVWRLAIGRTSIYLVDTDIERNHPDDRALSHQLYRGDLEMRLRQEIVLGIGGVRVLRSLGIHPGVWHANEGHAAFMVIERLKELIAEDVPMDEAMRRVAASTVFTTHTPVPAGHDYFPREMMERYFSEYVTGFGMDLETFWDLGRHPEDDGKFHMSALALRMADHRNGVSRLHGQVARIMWQGIWPEGVEDEPLDGSAGHSPAAAPESFPTVANAAVEIPGAPTVAEVPIGHITNGVHLPSWLSPSFRELFDRYLGPDWLLIQDEPALWERALDLPDDLLWKAHLECKYRLFSVMRQRARRRWREEGSAASQVIAAGTLLDPEVLTIGFARRFATYKRASLIFSDLDRLEQILTDTWRPVQLVFAGKAHPADHPGQELLGGVYRKAMETRFGGRIAFIEDYEINVARDLYSGVDVWLNNPRPPMEACGTSGQKAAINGVPQLSTLDGWWAEGWTRLNGWAINERQPILLEGDRSSRDEADALSLYEAIESEIAPLYYRRDVDGVPRGWIRVMKHAIRTGGTGFSARRMLKDYVERYYVPAAVSVSALESVSEPE